MMAKAELKTKKRTQTAASFINALENDERRSDAKKVVTLLKEITKKKPVLWGTGMIGFGDWHYQYASGREGDFFAIGFAPRNDKLTFYVMPGYEDFSDLLEKLGPYKKGKSCLHIKRLSDIHLPTLKKILTKGYRYMEKTYGV